MKIAVLITALALTAGTAFAANDASTERDVNARPSQSTSASRNKHTTAGTGTSVAAKTKHALQRAGRKVREAGHRVANAGRRATHRDDNNHASTATDSRSMGAAGTDASDTARQNRMDDAYANYKSRQK